MTGETKVYNITKNDLQNQKEAGTVRFGDKNYDVANGLTSGKVVINYNYGADTTAKVSENASLGEKTYNLTEADGLADYFQAKLKATSADTIKFICNSKGKIEKAYVVESKIARVTGVNSEKVSINNSVGTIKIADNDIYKGVAKDDIVVVTTLYNKDATNSAAKSIVTKATTVEGKLTSFKGTEKVSLDGKSYDIASLATTAVDSDFETSFADQIGESYILYTIGGIVYAAEQTSEGSKNYAVVENTNGADLTGGFDSLEVKIKKADGTEGKFEVHKDSTKDGSVAVAAGDLTAGTLIKYSDVADGKIKITHVYAPVTTTVTNNTTNTVYDKDRKSFSYSESTGATLKSAVVSSDAVLFVQKGSDWYSYTARNLNDITVVGNKSGTAKTYNTSVVLDDGKVVAAFVTLDSKPSGSTSTTLYGIVSKENGTTKIDDTTYTSYTVDVDASTQKTVLIEGDSDKTLKEGYLVSFDESSDSVYSANDITIYLKNSDNDLKKPNTMAAIYEYDTKGEIVSYWDKKDDIGDKAKLTTKALDKDVKIIYVDSEDDQAAEDNGAIEYDAVKNAKNAYIVFEDNDATKNVVAIFVDVDGNITK